MIVVVLCVRGVLVSVPVWRGGVWVDVCVCGVCGCDMMSCDAHALFCWLLYSTDICSVACYF